MIAPITRSFHRLNPALVVLICACGTGQSTKIGNPEAGSGGAAVQEGGNGGADTSTIDTSTIDTSTNGAGCLPARIVTLADGASLPAGTCPTNLPGPTLVNVPAPQGCTYCVDSTEVTNVQYAAFLQAMGGGTDASQSGSMCAWNTTYVPSSGWPATGMDDYPVVYVDWCDASAYCRWAGKHLCGKIGGDTLKADGSATRMDEEWTVACSRGGTRIYSYGNTYVPGACNSSYSPVPVASMAGCEGGYAGLFDLSGNVAEWVDSCHSGDLCDFVGRVDGGASYGVIIGCEWGSFALAQGTDGLVGFRCCSDSL